MTCTKNDNFIYSIMYNNIIQLTVKSKELLIILKLLQEPE